MELRFNGSGTDTDVAYLAKVNLFFASLFALAVFQNGWPESKLGSRSVLQKAVDWFQQMFQGGLTGNRIHIAARKAARSALDQQIQKILHYVVVMAEQDEIEALLQSGVVSVRTRKRVRKTAKPAVAS